MLSPIFFSLRSYDKRRTLLFQIWAAPTETAPLIELGHPMRISWCNTWLRVNFWLLATVLSEDRSYTKLLALALLLPHKNWRGILGAFSAVILGLYLQSVDYLKLLGSWKANDFILKIHACTWPLLRRWPKTPTSTKTAPGFLTYHLSFSCLFNSVAYF